jgi:penicillin amidase
MNRFSVVRQFSRSLPWCLASLAALRVLALAGIATAPLRAQDFPAVGQASRATLALAGLKAPVGVYRDTLGIPHIYAGSAEDAYFALGYLHATDRLFEMEVFRRRASGTLAEVFGKASLDDDIFVRQIGIRRSAEAAWKSHRLDGRIRSEMEAYCAGVNARLGELQKLSGPKLPAIFQQLGFTPAPWTPVDALAFPKYMGWDQSGTDTDVWMGMLVEKLGLETVDELFPLDRPYEVPTIPGWGAVNVGLSKLAARDSGSAAPTCGKPLAFRPMVRPSTVSAQPGRLSLPGCAKETFQNVRPLERRSLSARQAAEPQVIGHDAPATSVETPAPQFPPGFDRAALDLHRHFVSGRFGSEFALGSNNWVIDGTKSATGKPILASDPHLGFSLPSIWYTAHLVAPGLNIAGVTFAGFPYTVIGHNDRIAWGLTDMQADAVDYFIEKTDPQHPHQYFYKGAWRPLTRVREDVPVRGEKPVPLEIESTIHGPLVTTHGAKLALAWTGLEPTFEVLAFQRLNTARGLADYQAALKNLTVPALNVIYADVDGNIAIAPHGALPIRKRGLGRWPVDGSSGDYDWAGNIPDDQLPFALNPTQHFLASANGRPAPVGYPYYLGWMWDPSYRTRRIHELLCTHEHITVEDMEAFQMDAHDSAAEAFVPVLVAAYDRQPFGGDEVRRAIDELRRWNFEATPESVAERIWAVWFERFRQEVWQDDFDAAGVERWNGGWGFAGSNERQPELEVLEFLTRANPESKWFDDVRTKRRETRDDIMARSFVAAVARLVKDRGADMSRWQWGATNVLRLHSLTQNPALDRGGIPVRGDEFTLGPGANGGEVTGGASWRMVVDFSDLGHSFGMYPGGQSEDPTSPHYDDQMKPWAEGRYLPLCFYPSPQAFQAGQVESVLVLEPK